MYAIIYTWYAVCAHLKIAVAGPPIRRHRHDVTEIVIVVVAPCTSSVDVERAIVIRRARHTEAKVEIKYCSWGKAEDKRRSLAIRAALYR